MKEIWQRCLDTTDGHVTEKSLDSCFKSVYESFVLFMQGNPDLSFLAETEIEG
jgi:hypothetical protein